MFFVFVSFCFFIFIPKKKKKKKKNVQFPPSHLPPHRKILQNLDLYNDEYDDGLDSSPLKLSEGTTQDEKEGEQQEGGLWEEGWEEEEREERREQPQRGGGGGGGGREGEGEGEREGEGVA